MKFEPNGQSLPFDLQSNAKKTLTLSLYFFLSFSFLHTPHIFPFSRSTTFFSYLFFFWAQSPPLVQPTMKSGPNIMLGDMWHLICTSQRITIYISVIIL